MKAGQPRYGAAVRHRDRAAARLRVVQPGDEAGRILRDPLQVLARRRLLADGVRRPAAAQRVGKSGQVVEGGDDQGNGHPFLVTEIPPAAQCHGRASGRARSETVWKCAGVSRLVVASRTGAQRTFESVSTGSGETASRRPCQ
jgi:hypothetical protein